MKRHTTLMMGLLLILVLIFGCTGITAAQTEEYIPVHTEEELSSLFNQVKDYLDKNGEEVLALLDDTESQIVTNALIRSWGITQYEDASPQQIDDAYDALFNMSLFLGLATDPNEAFSTGQMFEYAVQLLDQEHYDLLEASGEDPENIEFAAYLRDISEALVEDPESFTAEEVEDFVYEIYSETYLAAGLKAISHTEALPTTDDLFGEKENSTMMPNPNTTSPAVKSWSCACPPKRTWISAAFTARSFMRIGTSSGRKPRSIRMEICSSPSVMSRRWMRRFTASPLTRKVWMRKASIRSFLSMSKAV